MTGISSAVTYCLYFFIQWTAVPCLFNFIPYIMFYLNWFSNDSFQKVIPSCEIESVSGDFYGLRYLVYCTCKSSASCYFSNHTSVPLF